MGGIGSGTHTRWDTRNRIDDMRALPIAKLARGGWLNSGGTCSYAWTTAGHRTGDIKVTAAAGHVVLSYQARSNGGEWQARSYAVQIERTPCHFGGTRAWFLCPARKCGRRVAILYGGAVFACRHCHQLAYPSENESRKDRTIRRAGRLRASLGWPPGIFNGSDWGKPKHMHCATFYRLERDYHQQEAQALGDMMEWLDRLK
jgi:hypothetical protein